MRFVQGVEAMRASGSSARSDNDRLVHHRARALGRHRHDAAGHTFGADDGRQRHQYSCRRQHRGLRAAPLGRAVAQYALQLFNREIERELGVANVLTTIVEPSIEAAEQIFNHPKIALLCVTGGPVVVQAASKSGKRVIAAGPGNPPVVVDETADLDRAARCIIEGAAFDNNLLCIGEKEIFVVASVADKFIDAMRRAGAYQLDAAAIERLTKAAFTFDGDGKGCARAHVKKDFVGKDVAVLAAAAGVRAPAGTQLLFGETE
jgi:aldehyde dehydrogenase